MSMCTCCRRTTKDMVRERIERVRAKAQAEREGGWIRDSPYASSHVIPKVRHGKRPFDFSRRWIPPWCPPRRAAALEERISRAAAVLSLHQGSRADEDLQSQSVSRIGLVRRERGRHSSAVPRTVERLVEYHELGLDKSSSLSGRPHLEEACLRWRNSPPSSPTLRQSGRSRPHLAQQHVSSPAPARPSPEAASSARSPS